MTDGTRMRDITGLTDNVPVKCEWLWQYGDLRGRYFVTAKDGEIVADVGSTQQDAERALAIARGLNRVLGVDQ